MGYWKKRKEIKELKYKIAKLKKQMARTIFNLKADIKEMKRLERLLQQLKGE